MKNYYVRKIKDDRGYYEVHEASCYWIPKPENREYLGQFYSCSSALSAAETKGYRPADGCAHCCPDCHKH